MLTTGFGKAGRRGGAVFDLYLYLVPRRSDGHHCSSIGRAIEKAAQAQNIRRREEVAATRSLLNTAKMIENNPVLMRLKELEAVERISDKVGKLTVYDGLKGVMKGMVSLEE